MTTKQELLDLVLQPREAGTITRKLLEKVRKQAMQLMFGTDCGDTERRVVDLELVWIAAGCPRCQELAEWQQWIATEYPPANCVANWLKRKMN
jgi:hypothetical protein